MKLEICVFHKNPQIRTMLCNPCSVSLAGYMSDSGREVIFDPFFDMETFNRILKADGENESQNPQAGGDFDDFNDNDVDDVDDVDSQAGGDDMDDVDPQTGRDDMDMPPVPFPLTNHAQDREQVDVVVLYGNVVKYLVIVNLVYYWPSLIMFFIFRGFPLFKHGCRAAVGIGYALRKAQTPAPASPPTPNSYKNISDIALLRIQDLQLFYKFVVHDLLTFLSNFLSTALELAIFRNQDVQAFLSCHPEVPMIFAIAFIMATLPPPIKGQWTELIWKLVLLAFVSSEICPLFWENVANGLHALFLGLVLQARVLRFALTRLFLFAKKTKLIRFNAYQLAIAIEENKHTNSDLRPVRGTILTNSSLSRMSEDGYGFFERFFEICFGIGFAIFQLSTWCMVNRLERQDEDATARQPRRRRRRRVRAASEYHNAAQVGEGDEGGNQGGD